MITGNEQQTIESFEIRKVVEIAAPVAIAFEAMLEQLGPESQMPDGKPFAMKIEAWPGGRWYRDLGNNAGHLWGHVQVIKPPTLLEICGPLMMSFAATNHVQYRLIEDGKITRLEFIHRSLGCNVSEHQGGMTEGWQYWLERIGKLAEHKVSQGKKR